MRQFSKIDSRANEAAVIGSGLEELVPSDAPGSPARFRRSPGVWLSRGFGTLLLLLGGMTVPPALADSAPPEKPTRAQKPSRSAKPQSRPAQRQKAPPPRASQPAPRQKAPPRASKPAPRRQAPPPRASKPAPRQQTRPRVESKPTPRQPIRSRVESKPTPRQPIRSQVESKPAPRRPSRPTVDKPLRATPKSPRPTASTSPRYQPRDRDYDRGARFGTPDLGSEDYRRTRRTDDGGRHTYEDGRGRRYSPPPSTAVSRSRRADRYRHSYGGYHSYWPRYRWYRPGYAYYDGYLGYSGYGRWGWGFYSPVYCNFYGSFWPWTSALSWYWPSRRVYVDVRHSYDSETPGALDLDVSPEKAQIYIDGDLVGVADDYDGFPTYLMLPPGTYEVAIFHPGFETIFRQYTIYPGAVIDVEDRMVRGQEVHPDDRGPYSTVNRDDRLKRNRERAEEARLAAELEEQYEREADSRRAEARSYPPDGRPAPADRDSYPSQGDPAVGRLLLDVVPPDAAVYLDGNFLGTAAEVSGMSAGLVVEPGSHSLEVTRPGYVWRQIEVSIGEGERLELALELEPEAN